ncbi:MAG: alpha/beta fold hydrolase [Oscillochloridaceae bacterium umkhey_bin13]
MTMHTPLAMAPVDLPAVMIDDAPVYYRETVPTHETHPPLLLLHGWGGSSRYWGPTMADLGRDRRVVAPDLPGFGDSPPLHGTASAVRLADVVLEFANRLGLEVFDLNGHSFCANVAVHVAARNPERVRRLVLSCVSTFRSERERKLVEQVHHVLALWMSLRRPWMANSRMFYRAVGTRFFYRIPKDDAILQAAFADFLKMDQRTALESAASAGDAIINPTMASLRTPTLVLGARQDRIMPPAGTPEVARLVPDSQLVWIERCGHLPMIERPEVYHQALRAFLD